MIVTAIVAATLLNQTYAPSCAPNVTWVSDPTYVRAYLDKRMEEERSFIMASSRQIGSDCIIYAFDDSERIYLHEYMHCTSGSYHGERSENYYEVN
jgi:hypothetical protein